MENLDNACKLIISNEVAIEFGFVIALLDVTLLFTIYVKISNANTFAKAAIDESKFSWFSRGRPISNSVRPSLFDRCWYLDPHMANGIYWSVYSKSSKSCCQITMSQPGESGECGGGGDSSIRFACVDGEFGLFLFLAAWKKKAIYGQVHVLWRTISICFVELYILH